VLDPCLIERPAHVLHLLVEVLAFLALVAAQFLVLDIVFLGRRTVDIRREDERPIAGSAVPGIGGPLGGLATRGRGQARVNLFRGRLRWRAAAYWGRARYSPAIFSPISVSCANMAFS